jgi:hypothetical protein
MSKRRRWLVGSSLGVIAAAVAVTGCAWLARSHINQENFDHIHVGMTLAEVEAILGGPARDESTGPLTMNMEDEGDEEESGQARRAIDRAILWWWMSQVPTEFGRPGDGQPFSQSWVSNSLVVGIDFDAEGKVTGKSRLPVRRVRESMLELLRRWLHC